MKFDINATKTGVCEQCGKRGLLQRCAVMLPMEAYVMSEKPDVARPSFITQEWCLGCMEDSHKQLFDAPLDRGVIE